jgi:RNA recognition motif-containing protein
MARKLYVGNLSDTVTDSDLITLFSQAGNVKSAKVFINYQTGRSKGFAFVQMSSAEEAESAIAMFHGKEFGGRILKVDFAHPYVARPTGSSGGNNPRMAGGTTTDAPPPKKKKKPKQ